MGEGDGTKLFLQKRVKGALIRSCLFQLKDTDTPRSFFLNLEKSVDWQIAFLEWNCAAWRTAKSSCPEAALDSGLTLEELTTAVNQMPSGRAPGIDGLHGFLTAVLEHHCC